MNHIPKINGWLNIDKPSGVTSNQVLGYLKREIRGWGLGFRDDSQLIPKPKTLIPKIGHAGTLDPMASGVLPIAIGDATKTIPYLMEETKTYEFTIKFGSETDTCDAEGKITKTTNVFPSLENLQNILPEFRGKIKQTPPAYSAIRINGHRAYDLAREGIEFEIKEREVVVLELGIRSWELNSDSPKSQSPNPNSLKEATLLCTCSKGTYIRSIGRDIAQKLGSLGHITYLRRVDYGIFHENQSVKLVIDENNKLNIPISLQKPFEYIISRIQSIDSVLDDIPVLSVDFETTKLLRNGLSVNFECPQGLYRVYSGNDFFMIVESIKGKLNSQRVFNF